jgi:hypothetical protein
MAATQSSPCARWFDRLEAEIAARNAIVTAPDLRTEGHMIIVGMEEDEDEEEDDSPQRPSSTGEEDPNARYTDADMAKMRVVLITGRRAKLLSEMQALILGDQAEDEVQWFNASFSLDVLDAGTTMLKRLQRVKDPAAKLDLLFAFTYELNTYDCW